MRHLPPRLHSCLEGAVTVLDIGAGDGRLASQLQQTNPALTVVGVDVHLQPEPRIPVAHYDGARLPFPDDSFDIVMLVDVLHHDENPERVLREALRVAADRVIVKDHYWSTTWDRIVLTVADYLGNRAYGVSLPYNFLRMEQWFSIFESTRAKVARVDTFHYSAWDRVNQVVFVLQPSGGSRPGSMAAVLHIADQIAHPSVVAGNGSVA